MKGPPEVFEVTDENKWKNFEDFHENEVFIVLNSMILNHVAGEDFDDYAVQLHLQKWRGDSLKVLIPGEFIPMTEELDRKLNSEVGAFLMYGKMVDEEVRFFFTPNSRG